MPLRALVAVLIAMASILLMASCGDDQGAAPSTSSTQAQSTAAVSGRPRHIVYLAEGDIGPLLERMLPNGPGPLNDMKAYRQLPGRRTVLPPESRIARITGDHLAPYPARVMAKWLRTAINGTCQVRLPCRSHLVSIDDINTKFRGAAGRRLLAAMKMLDEPSPWGSTYARRVVMYVPTQMMQAVLDGSPREKAAWAPAVQAVARGESYWLEMYQSVGRGRIGDVDYRMWTTGTRRMTAAIVRAGGSVSRTHFILGPDWGIVKGMPRAECPRGWGCQWRATSVNKLNRRIANNGSGLYRFGTREMSVLCTSARDMRAGDPTGEWNRVKALCDRIPRLTP